MSRPTLILSYFFPPYPGVGGRRWAKFAKYLARRGTEVHVVCARNPLTEISPWIPDVEGVPNLMVHRLPAAYPRNLLREPRSLIERAGYRATGMALGFLTPGAMFDHGVLWRFLFVRKASELIRKHDIGNVIATGAPFHVLLHALRLKLCSPDIRLISDFRDPWADSKRYVASLPAGRLRFEEEAESKVLAASDIVITPSDRMTETLRARAARTHAAFVTIHNGFDPEDLPKDLDSTPRTDQTVRLVYVGSLAAEQETVVRRFFEALTEFRQRSPLLCRRFRFTFVGHGSEPFLSFRDEQVRFLGERPLREVYREIRDADYGLMFGRCDPAYSMTVKFFEYIALRRKVVLVSAEDPFTGYLEENGIGVHCEPLGLISGFENLIRRHDSGSGTFNPKFDVDQFSLPQLTQKLESVLI